MNDPFKYVPHVPRSMMIRYMAHQLGVNVVELVGNHPPSGEAIVRHLGTDRDVRVPYDMLHDGWQDAETAVKALREK